MAEYRKKKGPRYAWHWCRNCTNDPKSNYETSSKKPDSSELCNECLSKDRDNECRK